MGTNQVRQLKIEIERLEHEKLLQSRILNRIREVLLLRTEWKGEFTKGQDLADIVEEALKNGPYNSN